MKIHHRHATVSQSLPLGAKILRSYTPRDLLRQSLSVQLQIVIFLLFCQSEVAIKNWYVMHFLSSEVPPTDLSRRAILKWSNHYESCIITIPTIPHNASASVYQPIKQVVYRIAIMIINPREEYMSIIPAVIRP